MERRRKDSATLPDAYTPSPSGPRWAEGARHATAPSRNRPGRRRNVRFPLSRTWHGVLPRGGACGRPGLLAALPAFPHPCREEGWSRALAGRLTQRGALKTQDATHPSAGMQADNPPETSGSPIPGSPRRGRSCFGSIAATMGRLYGEDGFASRESRWRDSQCPEGAGTGGDSSGSAFRPGVRPGQRRTSLIRARKFSSMSRNSASQRSWSWSRATRCGGATNSTPREARVSWVLRMSSTL